MDYPNASTYALLKNFDNDKSEKNCDRFFKGMYQYYASKGLGAIILTQVCAVLSLGFTIGFSAFLIAFVDWTSLAECHDETSCERLHTSVIASPFSGKSTLMCFLTIVYFLLFGTFWIWRCFSAVFIISESIEMAQFYHHKLGLAEPDLQDLEWYEVIERVIVLHNHGTFRMVPSKLLTVHEVALRIMRKDNYLIGMINKNCLDLYVPWWMSSFMSGRLFLTKSLEWSLSFCVLEYMFDDQSSPATLMQQHRGEEGIGNIDMPDISQDFLNDVEGLKWRFQIVGLIHFLMLPFMLAFMTVHFFLQNAQQFHTSKAYLGPRQWSPLALWQFREFNELPHIFEERINKSYGPTNDYLASFRDPYISVLARFVAYIAGAFMATLLLVSIVSEGVLLYVQYGEHNLLWYLGVFSAIFAASRAFIPDETKSLHTPEELLSKVGAHTHYFPEHWTSRAASLQVKEEIAELFQFKAQLFLMEVLSVVLTPAVLCFSLPSSAPLVVNFVRDRSKFVEGIGAVCDYSLFEFERYGDEQYACDEPAGAAASAHADDMQQSLFREERPSGGKLEKSFLNFKAAHPNYEGNAAGLSMCKRLNAFKDMNRQHREDVLVDSIMDRSALLASTRSYAQSKPRGYGPSYMPSHYGHATHSDDSIDQQAPPGYPPTLLHMQRQESDETVQTNSSSLPNSPVISKNNFLSAPGELQLKRASSLEEVSPFAQSVNPDMRSDSGPLGGSLMALRKPVSQDSVNDPYACAADSVQLSSQPSARTALHYDAENRPQRNQRTHSPPRIEMSTVRQHRSRSLLHDSGAGASRYCSSSGASSRNELPSVLMSVLRAENIDYENDFYWLAKFNHERRHHPQLLEKSLLAAARQRYQPGSEEAFSPVGRSFGGQMVDIYGTASATETFENSLRHDYGEQPPFGRQPSNESDAFSPPPRGYSARHAASTAHNHSPVISRNVMGAPNSKQYSNNRNAVPAAAKRNVSAPGLSQLSENDQED